MTDTSIQPVHDLPTGPWLDAEAVAPYLHTTAHTLRRLAREEQSPVVVRRIGGRWWFSRLDLLRFLDGVVTRRGGIVTPPNTSNTARARTRSAACGQVRT
jgi:hypothetical protein